MKKGMKKAFKSAGIILGVLLAVLAAYIVYLYASYHRIEDNLELQAEAPSDSAQTGKESEDKSLTGNTLITETTYSALTYNIGFGAYTPDFSFFMDGGKSSWAKSRESVLETVQGGR